MKPNLDPFLHQKIALFLICTYFAFMDNLILNILNKSNFLSLAKNHKINYDISNNLQNHLTNPLLSKKLILSIAIAIATNEKNFNLRNILTEYALENSLTHDELIDIQATVAIMSMNNTLYKFKHFVNQEEYLQRPSALKMASKAKPNFGIKTFEILALCISIVNNCQVCTIHHEEKCRELEFTADEIYAAVQLISTIKSISMMEFSTQ